MFLLMSNSSASCRAEIGASASKSKESAANHFVRGRCVWWKTVPTVTPNVVLQPLQ